jgi:GNAT superfamily N-acetyltransferase
MRVVVAQRSDWEEWLHLAAEVEPLFGPMVHEPGFHRALRNNIARGTAYCVRRDDGPPGAPLAGGLLFSAHPPRYAIGWLAVTTPCRRQGVGRALVEHVVALVQPPAEMRVTTFGPDCDAEGKAARRFYARMGFEAAEMADPGPDGRSRQIFYRTFAS